MMRFSLVGEEERRATIGPTEELPSAMKRAFDPSAGFEPIATPGPHDWLANHLESGQTVEEFVRSRPKRPDARRRTIYLQPVVFAVGKILISIGLMRNRTGAFEVTLIA